MRDVRQEKTMDFKPILAEESVDVLPEYGRIPISFEVHSIFHVELVEGGLQGLRLSERPVTIPWTKDYDAIKGERLITPKHRGDSIGSQDAHSGNAQHKHTRVPIPCESWVCS